MDFVIFKVEEHLLAIEAKFVERIVRSVKVSNIQDPNSITYGYISIEGAIIAVIDMRVILGSEHRDLSINDQFMICQFQDKKMVLWIDSATETLTIGKDRFLNCDHLLSAGENIINAFRVNNTIALVYDWEALIHGKKTGVSS